MLGRLVLVLGKKIYLCWFLLARVIFLTFLYCPRYVVFVFEILQSGVMLLLTGNGMNDVSFSPGMSHGSFTSTPGADSSTQGLSDSWSFCSYIGGGDMGSAFTSAVRNPNKAIVTVDAKTSEVSFCGDLVLPLLVAPQSQMSFHFFSCTVDFLFQIVDVVLCCRL